MARPVPSGTPERPRKYLIPHRRGRLIVASLAASIAVLVAVVGLYRAGYSSLASPGPVALRHVPIEGRCEECHRSTFPHAIADLGCERCHDPRVTGRLAVDAHASWTPPSRRVAGMATFTCRSCHTDHRGRLASLLAVDTPECAQCHRFSSLAQHPQFAVPPGGRAASRGLQFGHAQHLDEVRRTLGRGCEACHRLTPDLSGFEPTSFDRHCAACHLEKGGLPGMTEPVAKFLVSSPPEGRASDTQGGYVVRRAGRGRLVVSGLRHRDPWILQNMSALSRGLDLAADTRERDELNARVGALEHARVAILSLERIPDLRRQQSVLQGAHQTGRLLDRLNLELERRAIGDPPPVSLAAKLSEERALETALAAARARLAVVTARLSGPTFQPAERAGRIDAILSLATPCLPCHELRGGRELSPIDIDGPAFQRAGFSHAPHVVQVDCENCHETIAESAKTTDSNIPGLDSCRKCHAAGQAPSGCLECHRYHPSPDVGFGRPVSVN